jgi:hypothetical protein
MKVGEFKVRRAYTAVMITECCYFHRNWQAEAQRKQHEALTCFSHICHLAFL